MRLLIDMNLSPKWATFVEGYGFQASHWSTLGAPDASDPELMAFARSEDWVILTNALDFGAILAASGGMVPSVVQIRAEDLSIEAIGDQIIAALQQASAALASGALVTVDPSRARITLLPIAH